MRYSTPTLAVILSLVVASLGIVFNSPKAEGAEDILEIPFQLTVQGQSQTLTLDQLGVSQKTSFSWTGTLNQGMASIFEAQNSDYGSFEWKNSATEALIREKWDLSRPRSARFQIKEGQVSIQAETQGVIFNTEALMQEILADTPGFGQYELPVETGDPITQAQLEPWSNFVQNMSNPGLVVHTAESKYQFPAQLKDLRIQREAGEVKISLTRSFTDYVLKTLDELISHPAEDLQIHSANLSKPNKAAVEGHLKNGYILNGLATRETIQSAVADKKNGLFASVIRQEAHVVNKTSVDLGQLQRIGTGRSNFSNSPDARDFNVKKAVDDKLNGIIIPQGATFKFNDFLGLVTTRNGWKNSYTIVSGTKLVMAPGGGICQTSTTMYRAALDAGLDIVAQRPHSLYVDHYATLSTIKGEPGVEGDGLDSTIMPGVQDLIFVNNTPGPILVEAKTDADENVIVNFYGTPDGRSTHLDGPYTASNQTDEVIAAVGKLRSTQIAWKYTRVIPGREPEIKWLVSSYRSKVKQY